LAEALAQGSNAIIIDEDLRKQALISLQRMVDFQTG
jgi:quinolinate synthase